MEVPAKVKSPPLPVNYEAAKAAVSSCARVDECKEWADKAAALASYGKQSRDESLEKMAQRIRDRAIQRGGILLLELKTNKGGRPGAKKPMPLGAKVSGDRKKAARAAGITEKEATTMLRVAKVPAEKFEQMVESANPPTVTELASLGTKKRTKVEPQPYRNEWIDWTSALLHLSSLPACGLDVLAKRNPYEVERLRSEARDARINIDLWIKELGSQS